MQLMTQQARTLGMTNTTYVNASGLPDDGQLTTAKDQALLGHAIQERFPRYYKFFSTEAFVYRGETMRNHNHLLGAVEGVDGIKTGYTRTSGFNLITSVHRDGRGSRSKPQPIQVGTYGMTRIGEGRDLGRLEGCRLLGLALRNSERTVELSISGDGPAAHMSGREPAIGASDEIDFGTDRANPKPVRSPSHSREPSGVNAAERIVWRSHFLRRQ